VVGRIAERRLTRARPFLFSLTSSETLTMKTFAPVLLAGLLPFAALAAPETYVLDPTHTTPNFSIQHLGMSTVYGHFERATGKVVLDRAARTGSVDVKIPTATISTGDAKRTDGTRSRDEHLRTTDFFSVAEFPEMSFKSTKMNFAGDKIQSVDGTLTLLGVSKPVTLSASSFNCGANPMSKKEMCGGDLVATIKRTDFGMKYAVPAISDEVKLMIAVEAYKE
jgi:polyisoprenoid-binding protein YceI